jgi:AhpD family alkylhydroperoxidase
MTRIETDSLTTTHAPLTTFNVPTRDEVSPANEGLFDTLKKLVGFVPNLYAAFAHSETALSTYLALGSAKTSLSKKEKEAVNLVVSQVNGCRYCQSAHTVLGKLNGFTDDEALRLRGGRATDPKLDALVRLAREITVSRGRPAAPTLEAFYAAGYDKGSLVDLVVAVGDKAIMNYLHNITQVTIDFPIAPELAER